MHACPAACSSYSFFPTEVSRWFLLTGQTSRLLAVSLKFLNSSARLMICCVFAASSMRFCGALPACQ